MESMDHFMKSMADKMYSKFEKYWSTFGIFMVVAVVLDPRYKLEFVEWTCKNVYGCSQEHDNVLAQVVDKVMELYDTYAAIYASSTNNGVSGSKVQPTKEGYHDELMDDFDEFSTKKATMTNKDYLNMYYEDALLPHISNLDVLLYWKNNSTCYPPLALMAKDNLVQVSIGASEAAFSTGGCVLDSYRSSLKPSTVEPIICLRDWTFGEGGKCNG